MVGFTTAFFFFLRLLPLLGFGWEIRGGSLIFFLSADHATALERVPRSFLTKSQSCPICNNPFLDDPYPLVVRLPCHSTHLFDLECVRPWLRLRGTCPLDRTDFGKIQREKREERRKAAEKRRAARYDGDGKDDEEEWDGMYG